MQREDLPEDLRAAMETIEAYEQAGWKITAGGNWYAPQSPDECLAEDYERDCHRKRMDWARNVIPKYRYTKSGRVVAAMERISRDKVLSPQQACEKANKIARMVCPGSWWNVTRAAGFEYPSPSSIGYYKGRTLWPPDEREHLSAIQEAHEEGRAFTEVKRYKQMREVGLEVRRYRAIRVIKENKVLLNQLKKEINDVQNSKCGAVA